MNEPPEPPAAGPYGCTLALAIGFLTVAIAIGVHSLLTGAGLNLSEEWGPYLFQMLLVAAPFIILDAVGARGRWSWGAALAVTALLWCIYLAMGLAGAANGTGVNFAVLWLMLLSPVLVAVVGLAAAKLAKEM